MSEPLVPALHLDVLYERDDRGRLSRVRSDSVGTPLYSTSWDNEASRAVARRLGLLLIGEDWHLG